MERSLRQIGHALGTIDSEAADTAQSGKFLVLVERLLQALEHPGLPSLQVLDLAADLLQVAVQVDVAGLLLLLGDEFCQLVVEEPSLLQVAFLRSKKLRLLIVDSQVTHASLFSLLLDARTLLLLLLALGFEDQHVFVGDFQFAGLRLVLFMTDQGAFVRKLLLALFLRLYLYFEVVNLACLNQISALDLFSGLLNLLLVPLLLVCQIPEPVFNTELFFPGQLQGFLWRCIGCWLQRFATIDIINGGFQGIWSTSRRICIAHG